MKTTHQRPSSAWVCVCEIPKWANTDRRQVPGCRGFRMKLDRSNQWAEASVWMKHPATWYQWWPHNTGHINATDTYTSEAATMVGSSKKLQGILLSSLGYITALYKCHCSERNMCYKSQTLVQFYFHFSSKFNLEPRKSIKNSVGSRHWQSTHWNSVYSKSTCQV